VKSFINTTLREHKIGYQTVTVNLGSGGVDYSLFTRTHVHIDIALIQLRRVKQAIEATIDSLPIKRNTADLVICVGAALNYADPLVTVEEIARIMRPGATLILEFESSRSLEFIFTPAFRKDQVTIDTFFNDTTERLSVYSPQLIYDSLRKADLFITERKSFHIFSSLAIRLTKSEKLSQLGAHLDPLAQIVPGLRWLGANHILSAIKM
jgi:hypothetical protein